MILVGDSVGMVVQGEDTTLPVALDEMVYHCRLVSRGARRALIVGDLPVRLLPGQAARRGRELHPPDEGGRRVREARGRAWRWPTTIQAITRVDIPVVGHIGLTPQSYHRMGGHKVQGREHGHEAGQRERLLDDAHAVEQAGAAPWCSRACPARSRRRDHQEACRSPRSASAPAPTATARCWCCTTCRSLRREAEVHQALRQLCRRGRARHGTRTPRTSATAPCPTTPTASTESACSPRRPRPRPRRGGAASAPGGHRVVLVPTMGALHAGHLGWSTWPTSTATWSSCRSSSTRCSSTAPTTSTTTRARWPTTRLELR